MFLRTRKYLEGLEGLYRYKQRKYYIRNCGVFRKISESSISIKVKSLIRGRKEDF